MDPLVVDGIPTCRDGESSAISYTDTTHPYKKVCSRCQFMVNPNDHAARCTVQSSANVTASVGKVQTWDVVEKLAFFGDMLMRQDITCALRLMNTPWPEIESKTQTYISGASQAMYMKSINMNELMYQPSGISVRKVSSAFEANYMAPNFRRRFLCDKFPSIYVRILSLVSRVDVSVLMDEDDVL